jgi:hypothetical protein
MDDFECRLCGSVAVIYPKTFADDAPVACAGCANVVSSYGEFKQRAQRVIGANRRCGRVTGC